MEIRQLRYFVTVAQTRHFGQAAWIAALTRLVEVLEANGFVPPTASAAHPVPAYPGENR